MYQCSQFAEINLTGNLDINDRGGDLLAKNDTGISTAYGRLDGTEQSSDRVRLDFGCRNRNIKVKLLIRRRDVGIEIIKNSRSPWPAIIHSRVTRRNDFYRDPARCRPCFLCWKSQHMSVIKYLLSGDEDRMGQFP